MADPVVVHSDLEAFLVAWYQDALAGDTAELVAARIGRDDTLLADVEVVSEWPAGSTFPNKVLVIRDDGGVNDGVFTGERGIGLTVLAGTKGNPQDAIDLIRVVLALLVLVPAPDHPALSPRNPVAAVLETNGPYPIDEDQDRAVRYATASLAVTPEPL